MLITHLQEDGIFKRVTILERVGFGEKKGGFGEKGLFLGVNRL